MKRLSLFAFIVVLFSFSAPAFAQCSRSGSQLIVDGSFANNCSNWTYQGYATRWSGTSSCLGGTAVLFPGGVFDPGDEADQNTIADAGGSNFGFSFTYQMSLFASGEVGAIDVVVADLDASTYTQIDSVSTNGTNFCATSSVNLGSHPEWVNHHLQLEIMGSYSWIHTHTGRMYVTSVSLTQTN